MQVNITILTLHETNLILIPGAHQREPPSLILGLGVNPFPSRSINRTPPSVRRANQNRAMTVSFFGEKNPINRRHC